MKHYYRTILLLLIFLNALNGFSQATKALKVFSPDKKLQLIFWTTSEGEAHYSVSYQSQTVIKESRLGLVREDGNFSQGLSFINASPQKKVTDKYELYTGKRSIINYEANKATVHLKSKEGKSLDVIFQVSNDGVAFRYFFPGKEAGVKTVTEEITTFHFDTSSRAFLQPMQVSKTGWEKTNPAYEEHYKQAISVTDTAPTKAGWVYPALFQTKSAWVLITEVAVDTNFCATRLQSGSFLLVIRQNAAHLTKTKRM